MANDTPFSFHCMICFEEFDPEERYPVVLPCGHTYVCNACSERLEKCMECRMPLYMSLPSDKKAPITSPSGPRSSWATARSARFATAVEHSAAQHQQQSLYHNNAGGGQHTAAPASAVKKRLPLPKNVVLLSLIEATALASENVQPDQAESPIRSIQSVEEQMHGIRTMGSILDVEQEEEEKIRIGTSLAVGRAGTYAVAVRQGLEIFTQRPKAMITDDRLSTLADEDVENVVRFFGSKSPENSPKSEINGPNLRLSYGDRVQVVSIENGWAKLARGYGYVRAEGQQLVKVGNAIDRACKLEAILRSLSKRKKELRLEQTDIDNKFIQMLNRLQASLQNDEDLTVIVGDTFTSNGADEVLSPTGTAQHENDKERKPSPKDEPDDIDRQKAANHDRVKFERQETPPILNGIRLGCFAGSVFESDGPMQEVANRFTELPTSSTFLDAFSRENACGYPGIITSASHPSASAMRAGAQAWRDRHRQEPRTGVDFRTGMSGHGGLLATQARHPHEYLDPVGPTPPRTNRSLRMSAHTGLTVRSKDYFGILGALAPSVLRPRQEQSRDQVQPSGSL